jgi:MFS transporter, DHA1 family, multidrug resistance protein
MTSPALAASLSPQVTAMPSAFVIVFAGLLLSFNAVSCDIMLPAFFAIERDLGAGIERVQAIVPIFLMAAACGQLFFGPLSDRYGRRPMLLAGVMIYIAGCAVSGFSTSLAMLYGGRILQGTGAACGLVVARALMRDVFSGAELARAMSLAMAIFAIGPFLAPLAGATITAVAGWRGTFAALTLFGLGIWGMAWLRLAETNTVRDPDALAFGRLALAFRRVLVHPQSLSFILVAILLQASVASLVINSPRLFQSAFGIEGTKFALAFGGMALGVVIGQLLSHRAIARFGVLTTMRAAALINCADALLLALIERSGHLSVFLFVALLVLNSASFLVVMTNAMSLVIEPHRDIAGVAASVYGFLTQMTGSSLALLILPLIGGAMGPWTLSNAAFALAVLVVVLKYRLMEPSAV